MAASITSDPEALALVSKFNLVSHPEGGYSAETYRSELNVETPFGSRSASTAIYFLMTPGAVSRLHRIRSDEVWHHYQGGPLNVVELVDGECRVTKVGEGGVFQYVVKAGTWFGSYPCNSYSFVGCTVSPGFEFADFELGSRAVLLAEFPNARDLVVKLTEGLP